LAIATGIIISSLPVNPAGALRIVLLPILAHAAIFLRWRGIVSIACLCAAVYVLTIARPDAGGGPVGFLIEGTFTVVCMSLVVSTLKGRKEIERMADKLASANRHLGAYAAQAEELAAARERNRLAREIHDSVGPLLDRRCACNSKPRSRCTIADPGSPSMRCKRPSRWRVEGLREIRSSIAALRAAPLESRTLCEALLALVAECESAGLSVKIDVQGTERELTAGAGLTLYRAAQEGLTNVRKHAAGAGARLLIDFRPVDAVKLTVSDDGPGTDSINPRLRTARSSRARSLAWRHVFDADFSRWRLLLNARTPGMNCVRILLVDDQALFREGVRTLLSMESSIEIVGEAANGVDAVEAARTVRPDLVPHGSAHAGHGWRGSHPPGSGCLSAKPGARPDHFPGRRGDLRRLARPAPAVISSRTRRRRNWWMPFTQRSAVRV
jgi:CheY-like chemotaxis protein